MNILLCIAGMPGAGKSVVSDFFTARGYQFIRFGQIVLDEVIKRNLTPSESVEKEIRESIRHKYGMAAMAILNLKKFKKLLKNGNVIADGLYSWPEYKVLKNEFNRQFKLIAVYAPPNLRYNRISSRISDDKDTALRMRPFTPEEAEKRDYAEIENLEKGGPIAMADYTVLNTKDKKYLYKQLENILIDLNS